MPPSPSPPRHASPPPAYKHFCRVCNKGFTCGSALGGHMRAHAVGDDGLGAADDDDEPVPCARGAGGGGEDGPSSTATTTHVYALRANPNRLTRGCQVCKNCGEEFSSMELFLEHGKCNSGEDEDADGSPDSSAADGEEDTSLASGWSKGRRSRRAKMVAGGGDDMPATSTAPSGGCPPGENEEEDLANCLVMLSSCKDDQTGVGEANPEACASASKERGRMHQQPQPISFVMPAPDPAMVMPLALPAPMYATPVPRGLFECKACKKVFTSHQALGGHRASHKKVKGCFAAKAESSSAIEPTHHAPAASGPNDDKGGTAAAGVEANAGVSADARTNVDATAGEAHAGTSEAGAPAPLSLAVGFTTADYDPAGVAATPFKKKAKMHECSVCHRLFSSGQALGGHKRCHWLTSGTGDHANIASLTAEGLVASAPQQLTLRPMVDASEPALDLTIAANASLRATEAGTSSLHLDLQTAVVPSNPSNQNKMAATSSHNVNGAEATAGDAEDEADSTTVKKARLSDLKDESTAGETTPWLQVGLGSSSAGGDGKRAAE